MFLHITLILRALKDAKIYVDKMNCGSMIMQERRRGGDRNVGRRFYLCIFVYEHLLGAFISCLITTVVQVTV